MNFKTFLHLCFSLVGLVSLMFGFSAGAGIRSSWISPKRVMVIYNTTRMDSIDPAEPDSFSRDLGAWYMKQYGMGTTHLFGYDMGRRVKWDNPGAYKFLQAVADYIKANKIQVVLLAPGTPIIVNDINNKHNLALDSLVGHALWFAHVKKEAPACRAKRSVAPRNSNLYFPYMDMGDGASPFVIRTRDASRWCPKGRNLMIAGREWYDTMFKDLRDHPSVRPYGRIGLPYYLEAFPNRKKKPVKAETKQADKKKAKAEPKPDEVLDVMDIPLENSKFVKALVKGGMAATTSIEKFNTQSERCLLFFGREGNTASFIDVESSISEAMAQDAIMQGVNPARIVRIESKRGWAASTPLKEPKWDYTAEQFMKGMIKPGINPLIFSGGGVNNTIEKVTPWPNSLNVQPGLVAAVSVSNGKAFAGSLLRRGATTVIVNLHHPQDSRLHAWFSVFRQLVGGATVAEAMMTSGGAERGGYITGSIWGDPLYAPFGLNKNKLDWFTGKDDGEKR
ncbi:MAG: hypothetical protein L3J71_11290 [Victivallaceae bacterium]|nr:hypothetical protein [Victivallaceae bacterium]